MDGRTVTAVKCGSYDTNEVRKAFDKLFDGACNLDFVKKGMKIAVKVNLVSAMKPEKAATTHPALVAELCRRLCEKGADVTVGDSPGGPFTGIYLKNVYAVTGMREVEKYGAVLNDDFSSAICESFPQAHVMTSFEYTAWLEKSDCIINFAKLKTHGMMSLSACVKNMFGSIPGTLKPEYHYRFSNTHDFAEMLIDIDEYFKPGLNIIDGVVGMEGNGPTMGCAREIGVIVAGASPYAVDAVCADIVGLSKDRVPTLALAVERGLCPPLDGIRVVGDAAEFKIKDFKNIDRPNEVEFFTGLLGIKGKIFNKIAKSALSTRPVLKKKECIGCGKCESVCPADAIKTRKEKPVIDREKCIRCFCCQEFCPKGAMKVKRPLAARLLSKIK